VILTNTTALASRVEQTKAQQNYHSAMRRISSGARMLGSSTDSGGLSQSSRLHSERILDQSYRSNLQNARSFLLAQQEGLEKVLKVYDRMETLSLRAMDPVITDSDRRAYNDEFNSLVLQLEELMSSEYQGRRLYNATLLCGGVKNIGLEEGLDLANISQDWSHAIRSQTVDVHSSTGTLIFRVNSGGAGDIYRVWMGDRLVFSLGSKPPNNLVDHRQNYNTGGGGTFAHMPGVPSDYSFGTGWATSGTASNGDDDIIEVSFGPGKPTTYKIYLGASNSRPDGTLHKNQDVDDIDGDGNITERIYDLRTSTDTDPNTPAASEITQDQYNSLSNPWQVNKDDANTTKSDYQYWGNDWIGAEYEGDLSKKYGDPDAGYYTKIPNIVFTDELPDGFESTDLTLQIETETIGIIYQKGQAAPYDEGDDSSPIDPDGTGTPGITFIPEHPDLEIPIDHQGNKLGVSAKSFGTLYSESPVYGEFHSLENVGKASDTLDHLRGNGDYYGEARCVIDGRMSAVAAELNRIDREIQKLEERDIRSEAAIGKLLDADMATEATQLAKSKIRSDVAASCISKSIRINDTLIPLTTNHHRGAILKG